uniref:Uncharacterized protein n=1 Tax=Arundo donax TaxID=35708 RepID=A0A0A9A5L5_ARUDO
MRCAFTAPYGPLHTVAFCLPCRQSVAFSPEDSRNTFNPAPDRVPMLHERASPLFQDLRSFNLTPCRVDYMLIATHLRFNTHFLVIC